MRLPIYFFILCCFSLACSTEPHDKSPQSNGGTQTTPQPKFADFLPHADRLQSGEDFYRIMQGQIEAGAMRVNIFKQADGWLLEEYSTLELAKIREIIRTRLDLSTLQPLAHEVRGTIDGKLLNVSVTWNGNHIEGQSDFPRPAQKPQGRLAINAELPPGTQERTATFYLLPTLDLQEGTQMRFPWFNGLYAQLDQIQLTVTGTVNVKVPAGNFECYRVELAGGDPDQVVYLSKTTPAKVIKIEVMNLPWSFELL